jgi:cobalt/nickel transport system permease protein
VYYDVFGRNNLVESSGAATGRASGGGRIEELMHLHEAVLTGSYEGWGLLCAGAIATAIGTARGLRQLDYEQMPRVAMVSCVFFVVSLIHVPMGVTSFHLVLSGLAGLMLGWVVFPALLVALFLQAVLLQHGGILALGINTLTMGLPAVVVHALFRGSVVGRRDGWALVAGFLAGGAALLMSAVMTGAVLWVSGEAFAVVAQAVVGFHVVAAVIEGTVTSGVVAFLRKVDPAVLAGVTTGPRASWVGISDGSTP